MIKTITGNIDFIESLRGKSATFMLALSNTKTINIEGITQAGIPGLIHLTPTLDSEFVCLGEVRCLENIAQTPKGAPTPALMTRGVHLLKPFNSIEILNLGLEVSPKIEYFTQYNFDIKPSGSIDTGANIDAEAIFKKGVEFGRDYNCKNDYIILGESVPSGTTTANTTALALGYDAKEFFSSSFKSVPNSIREETINKALNNIKNKDDLFEILGSVSDNMLIFNAGFILGVNNRLKIILAGGTQMAGVLLIVNSILRYMGGKIDSSNLALCTTKWVAQDKNSNLKALLEMLDFPINSYFVDFDFSLSQHPALKLYDEGEAKEGVGAGGALAYGILNGLDKQTITNQVEIFLS
ncbi:MAG: TIGR00303 family protein [Sulfurovaceae bacterium]|nr:TIGR00303 family protein [Sulfurovaceae bacterium]